jgi:hypothetical protein
MAYKVLGQTLTTAASANIVVNLIKDPSFEGITRAITSATTSSSSSSASITGTQWYWQNVDGSYYSQDFIGDLSQNTTPYTSSINLTTAASRYGNKVIAMGSSNSDGTQNTYGYLTYGLSSTANNQSLATALFGGTSAAIPVSASTVYYYGCDVMGYSYAASTFKVLWFNSSGTYISSSSSDHSSGATTASWTRKNFSATSPSTAAYAGIQIQTQFSRTNQIQFVMDGVYFSSNAAAATTFPDPATGGTNSLLTAPFTGRYTAVHSGTTNNSTTVQNYAGAATDLYTVPAGSSAVVSTIAVSNPTTSATTYRIAVVKSGETLALKNWIAFDIPLSANSTTTLTLGITLATGDKIQVSNDTANVSFTAFGSES